MNLFKQYAARFASASETVGPTPKNWKNLPFCRENHREVFHSARRIESLGKYLPKGGHGAELGVFWAHFSERLLKEAEPSRLDLVDGWDLLFGETFPSWKNYTNFGKLKTADAMQAALDLEAAYPDVVKVHKTFVDTYFASLRDNTLDWIYVDASHKYDSVIKDLRNALRVVKPDGVILGDDYYPKGNKSHPGVRRAVDEIVAEAGLELAVEPYFQYVLLRPDSPRPQA